MGSGLMFARSPDHARVLFSRVAVIPWMGCQPDVADGQPAPQPDPGSAAAGAPDAR